MDRTARPRQLHTQVHTGVTEHEHDHHHHHHESEQRRTMLLLIVSAALYVIALLLDWRTDVTFDLPLYILAAAISGYSTFVRGLRNLTKFKFNTDTLMTIALFGAAAIGEWKEASLVAILFGLNELLEGYGKVRTSRSMAALLKEAPQVATLIADGKHVEVPVSSLRVGDLTLVKPGDKIPSDGTIVQGASSLNEAAITGESIPVAKVAGDPVLGGSINGEGALHVRIDKAYEDSSLARIWHLVQEARETKTPTQLFINQFARWYTPLIIVSAILVMSVPPLFGGDLLTWLYQGLAVLIIGCPCALILSSPVAIAAGIARNARNGILVKGGVFLEQLGRVDTIAFDKTGTLTKGEPAVEQAATYDEKNFFPVVAALERPSSHPLAKAVMRYIEGKLENAVSGENHSGDYAPEKTRSGKPASEGPVVPEQFESISGQGVTAVIQGRRYWVGNEQCAAHVSWTEEQKETIARWKQQGLTVVLAADEDRLLGMFGIADEIREESRAVVEALHRAGIGRTVMLSGDHQAVADRVASAVGIGESCGGLLPEDKADKIAELQSRGTVAMVGDGMNDAPALAAANLGIAMGKGTDSAIETADIVLMQDHLGRLPSAVRLSRRVNRTIRFNIAVALGLKALALLLAVPGLLTMWIAILSDMGATVFVTIVSLSILVERKPRANQLRGT